MAATAADPPPRPRRRESPARPGSRRREGRDAPPHNAPPACPPLAPPLFQRAHTDLPEPRPPRSHPARVAAPPSASEVGRAARDHAASRAANRRGRRRSREAPPRVGGGSGGRRRCLGGGGRLAPTSAAAGAAVAAELVPLPRGRGRPGRRAAGASPPPLVSPSPPSPQ